MKTEISTDTYLIGIGVSAGIEIGQIYFFDRFTSNDSVRPIQPCNINKEIDKFRAAVIASKEQLLEVKESIAEHDLREHVYIIDTHLLILKDDLLLKNTEKTIRSEYICADSALKNVLKTFHNIFEKIEDEYIRERQSDIDFVVERILRNLAGVTEKTFTDIPENSIIIARDLSPADTLQFDRSKILGFATDFGGKTSHTAILARSLGLPAIVGLENITQVAPSGISVVIDGSSGTVILNPSPETINESIKKRQEIKVRKDKLLTLCNSPAETIDHRQIELKANTERLDELESAKRVGATGIGLFRTEFLYMNRTAPPDEEEQFTIYSTLAKSVSPNPVTIRTLDIGGDKFIPELNLENEINPSLGLRAIRFSLHESTLFKVQLRAIYRASALGNIRIMVPMISTLDEIRQTHATLRQVKDELTRDGINFKEATPFGIMIEVPSAAIMADQLAKEVDFFSVGTNDLIQYSMAADRGNEHIAYLYDPLNPAILRLLQMICTAGKSAEIDVGICGEMANDPLNLPILVGLGLTELSMSPNSILQAKNTIRNLHYSDCKELLKEILLMNESDSIRLKLETYLHAISPSLLSYPSF